MYLISFHNKPAGRHGVNLFLETFFGTGHILKLGTINLYISKRKKPSWKLIVILLSLLGNLSKINATCDCDHTYGVNSSSVTNWSSTGLSGGGTVTSIKFCINGRLNIDVDASFNLCYFYMSPGSSIHVTSGSLFKASATKFYRCGSSMWNGITADDGELDFNHNWIYDAVVGIDNSSGQPIIQFIGNTIDRCRIGLIAENINPTRPFVGNSFLCTGSLISPYSGQIPYEGMELAYCTITERSCTFDNLKSGITSLWSTLTCNKDKFSHIDLAAISTYDGHLTVTKSRIRSAYFGVSSDYTDVTAKFDTITNIHYGFFIGGNTDGMHNNKVNDIETNEIDTVNSYAISLRSVSPTLRTFIDNNSITFGLATFKPTNAYIHEGIEIDNFMRIAEQTAQITNNHVYFNYSNDDPEFRGYELTNIENVQLNSNFARYRGDCSNTMNGVLTKNCDVLQIMGNTLKGGGGSNTPAAQGIFSTDMSNSFLCCNSLDSLDNGIHFSGANSASLIRGENFNGPFSSNALFFEYTMTGVKQIYPGNDWSGSSSNYDALFVGNSQEATDNPFIVSSGSLPFHPDDGIDPPTGWFTTVAGDEYACGDDSNCNGVPGASISCNDYPYDTLLLSHGYSGTHGEGLTWQAKKNLLQKLFHDSSYGCDSTLVENFKSDNESTTIGKLAKLGNYMSDLFQISHSMDSGLLHLDTILQSEMLAIMEADSMFEDEEVDVEYWEGIRAGHMSNFEDAYLPYQTRIDSLHEIMLDSIPSILSFISGITPGNIRDSNDVFVSHFALYRLLNPDSLITTTDSSNLASIANQCPLDGGDAVYRARSILRGMDIDYYNPGVTCSDETGPRFKRVISKSESNFIKMWPNPSFGTLNIQLPNSKNNILYNLSIYSLEGKLVNKKEILSRGDVVSIDLGVNEGLYYICVQNSNNMNYFNKVYIQR